MGTSKDGSGSNDRSPLVPEHADAEPGKPLPPREPNALRSYRNSVTRYIRSGSTDDRRAVLGNYARNAVGTSSYGYRRQGANARSGAAGIAGIGDLSRGGTGQEATGRDLRSAIGRPVEEAAQIIADAVAPEGQDRDEVRAAIQDAICQVLSEQDTFDPSAMTEDQFHDLLAVYVTTCVFHDLWFREAGASVNRNASPEALMDRENDLRETVRATVDNVLSQRGGMPVSQMSANDLRDLQLDVVRGTLEIWESDE